MPIDIVESLGGRKKSDTVGIVTNSFERYLDWTRHAPERKKYDFRFISSFRHVAGVDFDIVFLLSDYIEIEELNQVINYIQMRHIPIFTK